jgi:hypothetical protein
MSFKINFPGYDELFQVSNLNTLDKTPEKNDSIFPYFTTRFNTKKLDTKNINAENELSGRNNILTKSGFSGFRLNSTQSLSDDRPVILDTPELFRSAQNIKERKTCNTVQNIELKRLESLSTGYVPHPSVSYKPNTFLGENSRQIRRNEYTAKPTYNDYSGLFKKNVM